MIRQGAVKIDGERIEDTRLRIQANTKHVYQVGKRRFARVRLT
jgi:tyrosyl-tRNA synthetase